MKSFKYFSTTLIAIFLLNNCLLAQTNNASQQTSASLKGNVTICNIVQGGNVQHVAEDAPIVLYITDSVSNQKIQLVFSKEVRKKFSYDPEKKLPDHRACVSGKITEQGGSPAIVITNEKQIKTSDLTYEKK
jgi:hypothetical protein